MIINSKDP